MEKAYTMNLRNETIEILKRYGKTAKDVVCVIGRRNSVDKQNKEIVRNTWDWFYNHSDFDYNNGFGIIIFH